MPVQSTLLPTSDADPPSNASGTQIYAKSGGLFTRSTSGTISSVGGGSSLTTVASTILSSPASVITVNGLDGDADAEYEIEFNYIATGTLAHDVDIRPNGDTSSNRTTTRRFDGSTFSSTTGIVLANGAVTTAIHFRGKFYVWAKRLGSYRRRFVLDSTEAWNTSPPAVGQSSICQPPGSPSSASAIKMIS